MSFDLSFTQDKDWIAARRKAWEEVEEEVVEGFTRKQVNFIKDYFFTGVPSKWLFGYPGALVNYFPSYSREAMEYVFRELVTFDQVLAKDRIFQQMQANASLNLDSWPGASREEKLNLFKIFFGESYDPNRKFPFLMCGETEHRDYSYTAGGMLSIMLNRFVGWCRSEEDGILVWPDLVSYMLSIISHAEPWIFKRSLSEEERQSDVGGGSVGMFSAKLEELMKNIVTPAELFKDNLYASLRLEKLQQIGECLNSLQGPQELVEHWQWAKEKFANE